MSGPTTAIRPATPADLPGLAAAADQVFRTPPRPGLPGMAASYPLLFDPDNAGNLMLAVEDTGDIVAHAGFALRPVRLADRPARAACLGVVFTRADRRGQGLATRVFAAAVGAARAAGADLGLVSGGRALYHRAGFVPYPACRRFRVPAGSLPAGLTLAPAAVGDLQRLHAAEPTRFVRTTDQWRRLAATGVVTHHPGRLFAIARGTPVAYVALGVPANTTLSPRVLELAGDRDAIAQAAPGVAQALAVPAIDLFLPPAEQQLEALARQRGWPGDTGAPFACTYQRWTPGLDALPLPFYGLDYL